MPGWFSFLSATNFTKLERLHRAASRTITGCFSSSPIPLLLSEAFLPPLRVTLTHFILLSYERALRLPTSFPISDLAKLAVKPRLCRSLWRAFASTHPLMLPSTCSREALLACPPFPPWNLPSFTVESTLSSPCSRSDSPLPCQGEALAHLDSLPLMIWCFGQAALFLFLLARAAPAFNGSPDTRFSRGTTRLMSWSDGERYLRPQQSLVVSLLLSLVSALFFSRTGGVLSHLNSLTHRFPRYPSRSLCFYVMLAVLSLVFAATDTAFF